MKQNRLLLIAVPLLVILIGLVIYQYGYLTIQEELALIREEQESKSKTLGKYLAKNIYVTYTGQIIANANPNENDFGFNHTFGVEYRFFKNLLLEFEYDRETLLYTPLYMEKPYLEDFKVRLRHSFSF